MIILFACRRMSCGLLTLLMSWSSRSTTGRSTWAFRCSGPPGRNDKEELCPPQGAPSEFSSRPVAKPDQHFHPHCQPAAVIQGSSRDSPYSFLPTTDNRGTEPGTAVGTGCVNSVNVCHRLFQSIDDDDNLGDKPE